MNRRKFLTAFAIGAPAAALSGCGLARRAKEQAERVFSQLPPGEYEIDMVCMPIHTHNSPGTAMKVKVGGQVGYIPIYS